MYFNPHEREARDQTQRHSNEYRTILIHTSVKLVTMISDGMPEGFVILIHTSVKLVTPLPHIHQRHASILIHTSVKLVTIIPAAKEMMPR